MRYETSPKFAAIAGYGWARALSDSFIVLSVENPPAYGAATWRTEAFANALALYIHREIARGGAGAAGYASVPWDFAADAAPMTAEEAEALKSYWVVLKGAPTALSERAHETEPYRVHVVGAGRRGPPAPPIASPIAAPVGVPVAPAERWTDWLAYFVVWTLVSVSVGVYLALVQRGR